MRKIHQKLRFFPCDRHRFAVSFAALAQRSALPKPQKRTFAMTRYFDRAEEIRHLSDEQIEEIYKRYLEGEKTSQLMEQFQIPSTVRSLLKVLPPIVSTD